MTYQEYLAQEIRIKNNQIKGVTEGNHPDRDKILGWLDADLARLNDEMSLLSKES